MLELFYIFIAHLVGDNLFSWKLNQAKRRSLFYLGIHSLIYSLVVWLALYLFAYPVFTLFSFILLLVSHFVIDYWKCYIVRTDGTLSLNNLTYSIIDQILHIMILILILYLFIK
mgnify:CR=1 FL=1